MQMSLATHGTTGLTRDTDALLETMQDSSILMVIKIMHKVNLVRMDTRMTTTMIVN